jgi:hypothetical protein
MFDDATLCFGAKVLASRPMKVRSGGLLLIFAVCALAVSCAGDDDDAKLQETGGSASHGGAAAGSAGKAGSTGTGAASGGGKGGTHQGTGGGNAGGEDGGNASDGEGGNAGGGEGGSVDVGGVNAMRRARCEAVCSIGPTGDALGTGMQATGAPCGSHYDECVDYLCGGGERARLHESECLAAQDALYPCLLELDSDKFYCGDAGGLAIDYAGYYFCFDLFMTWALYCG